MESLGDKVRTISLVSSRFAGMIVFALACAGLILYLTGPSGPVPTNMGIRICFMPLIVVLVAVAGLLLIPTFFNRSVTLYQRGLVIRRLFGTDVVRWDEVSEVRYFNLVSVQRQSGFPVPVILPFVIGIMSVGGGISRIFESTYLFTLRDGRTKSLSSDARLFDLAQPILLGTFPYLVRDAAQILNRGEDVPLHEHITYSLKGLKGSIVKGLHGRKRLIPFEITWAQYSGYKMGEGVLILQSEKQRLTGLKPIEVSNLHVFAYLAPILKRGDTETLAVLAGGKSGASNEN